MEGGAFVGFWQIAAPDVCDGTSAVGESRHRIPKAHPLVNRLNLALIAASRFEAVNV
jgi:hypothetical protein